MKPLLKKFISSACLSVLLLSGIAHTALAQNELLFGQQHFYSVVFRGNGEAITYAKLIITNPDNKPLTEYSFEVPKVTPTEMAIYQIKLPQTCVQYGYDYTKEDYLRPCLKYEEPDYSRSYYSGSGTNAAVYTKIEFTKTGNLYHLTLPNAIQPFKTSALVVAYAAKGYVRNTLGLSSFTFETLKVPSRIQEVRVSVDVDSDLFLKGKKAEVNYASNDSFGASTMALSESASSPEMDNVVRKIGSYGSLVKEAKNLAPNESYTVKGEYASSWFRLNLSSFVLTIMILGLIVAGLVFLMKIMKRRRNQRLSSALPQQTASVTPGSQQTVEPFDIATVLVSFVSVVLIIGLTVLIKVVNFSRIEAIVGYNSVFIPLLFIALILLYVLILVGPAIYIATKKGWKAMLWMLLAEFLWFVVLLILYVVLFQTVLAPAYDSYRPVMNDVY